MRLADIEVGAEYAHRAHNRSIDASRVAVREKLTGGRLRVKVLEPAAASEQPLRRGALIEVTSRSLATPWTAWPELAAAEQRTRDEEAARRRERRTEFEYKEIADPGRALPAKYDERWSTSLVESPDDLRDWPIPSLRLAWRKDRQFEVAAALRVLKGLPVALARDLLAAASIEVTDSPSADDHAAGSVGAVLGPLAWVLVDAMDWAGRGSMVDRLADGLLSATNEFVGACAAVFAEQGGRLRVPETPPLEPADFPGPGWLRVSYGESTGRRLHAPDCHVLKGQKTNPNEAATWPAWRLNLPGSAPCGNCDGPGLAATPALFGFLTATVVWLHRSRKSVEQWQLRACLLMLADAAEARAVEVEPDSDWVGAVVTALLLDRPGDDGWDAYNALQLLGGDFRDWEKAHQKAALDLAYRRLIVLSDALPASRRPADRPPELDQTLGDAGQRRQTIQRWYRGLSRACAEDLPGLDHLLFGLPGAIGA
jgi:hypothetical protein